MKYGRECESFLMWSDSTAEIVVRWSPNEADRLYDALTLYRAEREPRMPEETTLITGDAD